MTQKGLPPDALAYYLGLGSARSYQTVAQHFGVSKRTVTSTAVKEGWKEAVERADKAVREKASEGYVETLHQMNERHLKVLRFIQGRSIESLKSQPIGSAMDAVRAFTMAVEKERLIRGEPTDRTENIEAIIRREYEQWMVVENDDDDDGDETALEGIAVP